MPSRVVWRIALAATLTGATEVMGQKPLLESQYQSHFVQWMTTHNKSYEAEEFLYRYSVFKQTFDDIEAHNAKGLSWTKGLNQFSDLTPQEWKKLYVSGLIKGEKKSTCSSKTLPATSVTSVDWTTKGFVTPVKDQGQCGSCWSFSTTGAVEGAHFKATQKLVALSEQQLMDCSWGYGNLGCHGGQMDAAFEYLIDNGGSCTEAELPYAGKAKISCPSCTKVATISACYDVPPSNKDQLMAAIAANGPVSIAIEADQSAFQSYKSGVLTGECGQQLDHGVLVVGYDNTYSTPYWKVKNSWNTIWGDEGYIKIAMEGNLCGVTLDPSYPVA